MSVIKPFKGVRPPQSLVEHVASKPYDVINSQEAFIEAGDNEKSLYRITRPEIDFEEIRDEHGEEVYEKAVENFKKFQEQGWLIQDEKDSYYIYAQTMDGRTQYGLVAGVHVSEYENGKIKKHELTRRDKEEDRKIHVDINDAHIEPVFFTYNDVAEINSLVESVAKTAPEYDFTSEDGIRHQLWVVHEPQLVEQLTSLFADVPSMYIADGHHRSAAAASVAKDRAKNNPDHSGEEEYNFVMAVCFPASQLYVMDYNRVVKDLNGYTSEQVIEKLKENFEIEEKGDKMFRPEKNHEFSIYMDGKSYLLKVKDTTLKGRSQSAIDVLDVSISSEYILDQIFGIKDLRSDKRIDFIGGIRGVDVLKELVDSGKMKFALALHPVTIQQIMNIADLGEIMPPKTTWFEPKLRSGLVIHKLT